MKPHKKLEMKKTKVASIFIAILSFAFPIFDHFGYLDRLSGIDSAKKGISRLASVKGWPEIAIFDNEPEFKKLIALILKNSSNEYIKIEMKKGSIPTLITCLGIPIKPNLGNVSTSQIDASFVPDSFPVLVFYNLHANNFSK